MAPALLNILRKSHSLLWGAIIFIQDCTVESVKLPCCLGAEEQCQRQAYTGRQLLRAASWWRGSIYGGLYLYARLRSVLCPTSANLHPSVWEKARPCRWSHSVGQGELCDWKLAESSHCFTPSQLVALHHPRRAGQVPRLWQRGRAGIKHESRSGTPAAMQGERTSQAVGSRLRVEPGSSSERTLWTWDYPATAVKLDSPLLEKRGENEQSFIQQSTILVRLLKRSMLNWKAKRFEMGGCNKRIMKDRVWNLAGQWQESPPFVNLIGVWHSRGGSSWAFPSGTSD